MKTLDLHGYSEDDAVDAIDRFLLESSNSGLKRVVIVTGKGKGIIQKKTMEYLEQARYQWKYDSAGGKENTGSLVIFLD